MSTPFMKMFGTSPFKLLEKHINIAYKAVSELRPFMNAIEEGDWPAAEALQIAIAQLENKADDVKREVRTHLPKGIFLPVSRGDILSLISAQDKIANKAKDIAGLMLGRKMEIPPTMQDLFNHLIDRCIAACFQAKCVLDELDVLLESCFRGNEIHVIEKMITELDKIEHETDELQIKLRSALFMLEKTLPPIEVMFLYKIIENVGGLADCAHHVGGQLQVLLAR